MAERARAVMAALALLLVWAACVLLAVDVRLNVWQGGSIGPGREPLRLLWRQQQQQQQQQDLGRADARASPSTLAMLDLGPPARRRCAASSHRRRRQHHRLPRDVACRAPGRR
eukprot:scaffold2520_cov324-Prasinococcus_capsulatus_cf.AAC.7